MAKNNSFLYSNFEKLKDNGLGAIVNLNHVISGMTFTISDVKKAFKKLVPKDEYEKNERKYILADCLKRLA